MFVPSEIPLMCILVHLIVCHKTLRVSSLFFVVVPLQLSWAVSSLKSGLGGTATTSSGCPQTGSNVTNKVWSVLYGSEEGIGIWAATFSRPKLLHSGERRRKVNKSSMKVPAIWIVAFSCLSVHLVAVELWLFSRALIISFSFFLSLFICFRRRKKGLGAF